MIPVLAALLAGAAAMYCFDPDQGRRRRARLRQWLDGSDRAAGTASPWPAPAPSTAGVRLGDAELRGRVRARLGRLVSHPRAIDVAVDDGVVRLSGHVLAKERDGLLTQVREMDGVVRLVNAMTAHDSPQGIARLDSIADEPPEASWAPAARP